MLVFKERFICTCQALASYSAYDKTTVAPLVINTPGGFYNGKAEVIYLLQQKHH